MVVLGLDWEFIDWPPVWKVPLAIVGQFEDCSVEQPPSLDQ